MCAYVCVFIFVNESDFTYYFILFINNSPTVFLNSTFYQISIYIYNFKALILPEGNRVT